MQLDQFWHFVEAAKAKAGSDTEARVEALRTALSGLSPAELQSFQNHYDRLICLAYRWDLWAAAYIINGGCGDDGFRYFRDWLISEGRSVFEAALKDPESLADLPHADPAELEAFNYVAYELYEQKGAGKLAFDYSTESPDPAGTPWEEDAVEEMFPKLSSKYG